MANSVKFNLSAPSSNKIKYLKVKCSVLGILDSFTDESFSNIVLF